MNLVRKAVGAIIYRQNKFLFVHKTKINTIAGKEDIEDEWDFIKGGVKKDDVDLRAALLRELKEETGSTHFHIVKEFTEKLSFEFPDTLKSKIGYEKEETTMFLVQYLGDLDGFKSKDDEISDIKFHEKDYVVEILTHEDTKSFFIKHLR